MAPQASRNKTQRTYDFIRANIESRAYAPGDRLLFAEIANANEVSIVPVREAVRLLEAEGLVTVERNVGAFVTYVDDAAYLRGMQVLAIVEGAATGMAAPLTTEAELAEAEQLNADLKALLASFDSAKAAKLNHRFHDVLMRECPNTDLLAIAANQWSRLAGVRDESCSFTLAGARETVVEHDRLVEMVRSGADQVDIEQAMRQHRLRASAAYLAGQRGE